MTKCDSLERSTGKYVQPLTYYVQHDDSRQNLLTREDSAQYQSLQAKNMNYISIYSIPTESSTSRQVTPKGSHSGPKTPAKNNDASLRQAQLRSKLTAPAQLGHHHQGNYHRGNHHQDNKDVVYTSLDVRQREYSRMYDAPQSNPAKH